VKARSFRSWRLLLALALMLLPLIAFAAPQAAPAVPAAPALSMPASPAMGAGIPVLTVHDAPGGAKNWTLSLQLLGLMTVLTLLPAILLMMTSFTRIIIVLGFLRQALGTQSTPPNQVLLGLALFLTLFVMGPVFNKAYSDGVKPYMDGQMTAE
jgi:flagellar biosynthesis protein FliP